ncbi:MAG: PaaI family thioesterase [Candidatus Omnitrophica bacterium]|jgi:acyl-CoA thioesterase|nr:PaaI family thioesterase [Candidatus Omnitrophota bacterium]MDD3275186.1 PaaI family thioesterase [Candidatus Omnitrophota bacterium]MDD5077866.1 PaaI family thioesterase [Candidatus Omnitrophota bacterium]MDD5725607.1 PaaI family thioesterase [Candidatus Omnitrophota bacterium]
MSAENPALDDKFAQHLKIEVLSCEEGHARAGLKVQPYFLNGAGFVHGGVIFTLADYVFALAANAGGNPGLAVNSSVNFIKTGLPADELTAEAVLVSRSRKLGTYQVEVRNQNGDILARMQTMAYFK